MSRRERDRLSANLKSGLKNLGLDYRAQVCGVCDGGGEYEQTYNAGCGMGYFKSTGRCDHCGGFGLVQNGRAAPYSVIEQVLGASTLTQESDHVQRA